MEWGLQERCGVCSGVWSGVWTVVCTGVCISVCKMCVQVCGLVHVYKCVCTGVYTIHKCVYGVRTAYRYVDWCVCTSV